MTNLEIREVLTRVKRSMDADLITVRDLRLDLDDAGDGAAEVMFEAEQELEDALDAIAHALELAGGEP